MTTYRQHKKFLSLESFQGTTTSKIVHVRTDHDGIGTFMGPYEVLVMETFWDIYPKDQTAKRCHLSVLKALDDPRAHTSTQTTIVRLVVKGLLVKTRKSGNTWIYAATSSREEFVTQCVAKVIRHLHTHFPNELTRGTTREVSAILRELESLDHLEVQNGT